MKIGYVTTYDSSDRKNWSGLGFAIRECLRQQGAEIFPIGPLPTRFPLADRVKRKIYSKFLKKEYELIRRPERAQFLAQQIHNKMGDVDVIFSPGSIPISHLNHSKPIYLYSDATFASYINHYGGCSNLTKEEISISNSLEKAAYDKCKMIFFSSDWAAASAMDDYGVPQEKIRVVPFGPNFQNMPSKESVLSHIACRSTQACNLVAIGVDWKRKGMQTAVELAQELIERGIPSHLTIIGCTPPATVVLPSCVTVIDFIDKRTLEGEERLSNILMASHFHVLFPTAEAFGVVFSEANAHGAPNLSWNTGGVSSAVRSGFGGMCFPKDAAPSIIADYVQQVYTQGKYNELACKAYREFEERLNWQSTGKQLMDSIRASM